MPKRLNYSGGGLCCVFERLEIINKPLKYLIVLRDNQIKLKMLMRQLVIKDKNL